MATEADRKTWLEAANMVEAIDAEREALLAPTRERYREAQARLDEAEERCGGYVCTCEACGRPVFEGEPHLGGETPLCGECAPTYADLLEADAPFVDAEGELLTPEARQSQYDAHIAAGGAPTDSMAR